METPSSICDSMHPGDWGISIDLKDAYFHLLFHPRDRKYLRFVWRNHIFQFRALPFGLAPAPWVFTKVARELCLHVRERGIRLKAYLDDGLLLASSRTLCTQQALQVLSLCRDLGFVLNEEKSDLVPAQQFQFLRRKLVLINTDNTTVACYVNKQGGGGGHAPTRYLRERNSFSSGARGRTFAYPRNMFRGK
ncbi:hypothetical protein ACOMHN_026306 [Nucella lapillus]